MRKTYSKPLIECAVVNTVWAMCDAPATVGENDEHITDPDYPFGGSPKRRVF